jgi:hypothetical protein
LLPDPPMNCFWGRQRGSFQSPFSPSIYFD